MTKIFDELLKKRRIGKDFLTPEYRPDFYTNLPDLKPALKRLCQAIHKKEKILIYGDYDADGVTASTVMKEGLELAGAERVEVMLPDRFKDGYGMGPRVVERAKQDKVQLVVTVDCGSNNAAIVAELAKKKIDTVVTDHHEISGELPKAVAVVNPKRLEEGEPLRDLAGVGVAFMVVYGLMREGLIPEGQEKWLLDLVMIGTLCDSMEMTRLNRELGFYGMKVLKKTRRVGLAELMKAAGMKEITAETVGFLIGPRINAAGRMDSPKVAFDLLNTTSKAEAMRLAERLNELNEERKKAQGAAVREIGEQGVGNEPVIVTRGDWHEGVLGIVAGRLTEEYKRPAFVLTEVEPGVLKGSGRSFGEFNLAKALQECQKWIVGGGGHSGACGLKVLMVNFEDFKTEVNEYYKKLKLKDQEQFLRPVADLTVTNLKDLTVELVKELQQLEPYGPGNMEPVFCLDQVEVLMAQRMGEDGKHIRMTVKGQTGILKVVAFYAPKEWLAVQEGQRVNLWVTLTLNEWNGQCSAEGRIVELEV